MVIKILKSVSVVLAGLLILITSCSTNEKKEITQEVKFDIPPDYLREAENIPVFWKSTVADVTTFLQENVKKGKVEEFGTSAGGRTIRCVLYGNPREGKGTSTFSGSLGFGNVKAYRGLDHEKTVYIGMSSVHGGELEGIVGVVNLISVLETGKDLRGKEWPAITEAASKLGRIILIPVMNPDGRERVPLKMEAWRDSVWQVYEYLNTGGKPDHSLIGWPQVKEFIPLDFKTTSFPGGYPNDNGVNIMHDDFFGDVQPETQALLDLCAREKPDLVLNMHTGAPLNDYYIRMHRPFAEPALDKAFDSLYTKVHSTLALNGLQGTNDPSIEADFTRSPRGVYNLDAAINLHCGGLSVVIESPCHGHTGKNRNKETVVQTPEMILDAHLTCHQAAMQFLVESGGRSKWTPGRR